MSVWVLLLSLAAGCTVWTCQDNEDTEVCATWTADKVLVNSQGCANFNQQCTYSLVLQAMENNSTGLYACELAASPAVTKAFPFASCGKREPEQRRLKSGTFPQECEEEAVSDPACELNDGTFLPCICGLNGRSYCQPNPSDTPFDAFWTACEEADGVVSEDFFRYYELMSFYYAQATEVPDCITSKIYEFKKLSSLAPDPDLALTFVLSSFWLW